MGGKRFTEDPAGAPPRRRRGGLWLGACALVLAGCAQDPDAETARAGVTSNSYLRIADATMKGGDAAMAATFYRRAALAAPNDPIPALGLGHALMRVGGHRGAAAAFREAVARDPANAEALRGLGGALLALELPRQAAVGFRAALEAGAGHLARVGLGVALDMMGDHAAAQKAYRAVLADQPGSLNAGNNLGLSLAFAGRHDEAVALLRRVAAHPAATARHRQNLALAYGLAGRMVMAARIARLDLDPAAVERNLVYYAWLRRQPAGDVARAVLGGGASGAAGGG